MTAAAMLCGAVAACYVYLLVVFAALLTTLIVSALEHRDLLRWAGADDDVMLAASRFTIPVSVIVPAYNEGVVIESAVRSLLELNIPKSKSSS